MKEKLSRRYLAGLMDGEGYLSITIQTTKIGRYYKPTIKLAMCDPRLVRMVASLFGGHAHTRQYPLDKPFRDAYEWEARTFASVRQVLDYIQPYLILKQAQADVLREFLATQVSPDGNGVRLPVPTAIVEKRAKLYALARVLNRRGRPPAETKSECSPAKGDEAIVRSLRNELREAPRNAVLAASAALSQN